MNVTLNMPVETGIDRTGRAARRDGDGNGEAGDFRALFDQAGQATAGARKPRSAPLAGAEEPPEEAKADATARGTRRHGSGETVARNPKPEVMVEEASATSLTDDGNVVRRPRPAGDAPDRPAHARKDEKADRADASRATRAEPRAAAGEAGTVDTPPADTRNDEPLGTDKDVAHPVGHRNGKRADRKDDSQATWTDGKAPAAPSSATAAVLTADSGKSGGTGEVTPEPDAAADSVTARDDRQANRKTERQATPADAKATVAAGRERDAPAAVPVAKPAPADPQDDSAPIRYWARGDSLAAFAAHGNSDRRSHTQASESVSRAAPRIALTHGADRPIDVRVTAYERHPAALVSAGAAAASVASDGNTRKSGAPTPMADLAGVQQAAAGSVDAPRVRKGSQGWEPLMPVDRGGTMAAAKAPSDRRIAIADEAVATPQSSGESESDKPERQDSRMARPVLPLQGDDKRQVTAGPAATGAGAATAGASAPPAAGLTSPLAAGVASSIASAANAARAAAGQSVPARIDPTNGGAVSDPVRTIALSLDMHEHGQVDLRISLRGNALSIHLKAERQETTQALARDDASLRDLLHRAGYDTQQVQVDRRDGAGPRLGDAAASGQQAGAQAGGTGTGASSGHAAGDQRAASPDQRPQAGRDDAAFPLHDQDVHDAPRQDRYRGPDRLYV